MIILGTMSECSVTRSARQNDTVAPLNRAFQLTRPTSPETRESPDHYPKAGERRIAILPAEVGALLFLGFSREAEHLIFARAE